MSSGRIQYAATNSGDPVEYLIKLRAGDVGYGLGRSFENRLADSIEQAAKQIRFNAGLIKIVLCIDGIPQWVVKEIKNETKS